MRGTTVEKRNAVTETSLIVFVSFAEGLLSVSKLAKQFYMKDVLRFSPAEMSLFAALADLPWMLKPLTYFYCASVPFFGYHRKYYYTLFSLLGALAWFLLGIVDMEDKVTLKSVVFFLFLLCELYSSISDLFLDALVIERIKHESLSSVCKLQTMCSAAGVVGDIISSYISGYLIETIEIRGIFVLTTSLPIITCFLSFFLQEERAKPLKTSKIRAVYNEIHKISIAFCQPSVWKPALFMFLWQMVPTLGMIDEVLSSFAANTDHSPLEVGMLYFATHEVKISTVAIGNMEFGVKIASLIGLYVFNAFFSNMRMQRLFPLIALLAFIFYVPSILFAIKLHSTLGVDDHLFAMIEKISRLNSTQMVYRAALLLAAEICNSNSEPGFYSVLMAVMNIGEGMQQTVASLIMSTLDISETNFVNLWVFIVIVMVGVFIPILFISPLLYELVHASVTQNEVKKNTSAGSESKDSRRKKSKKIQ